MPGVKDCVVYIQEAFSEFYHTGSVFPTSRWAAMAMTRPLRGEHAPMHILEAGPGTGVVTERILKTMSDRDSLVICEINPKFMQVLKEKLSTNPDFIRHKSRVSFFEGPVQNLPERKLFDMIVCSLPFLNFELSIVEDIFAKFTRMSTPATVMTYYEYIGLRDIGMQLSLPERRKRLQKLNEFFDSLHEKRRLAQEKVWLNILPINIYTMRVAA